MRSLVISHISHSMWTCSFYMFFKNCSEKPQFNHFLFCFYKLKDTTLKCLYFIVINHFIVSQFHWNYKTNKEIQRQKKHIKIKVFFLHCQPVRFFTLTHANNLPLSFPTNCTVTYLFPSRKQTKATNANNKTYASEDFLTNSKQTKNSNHILWSKPWKNLGSGLINGKCALTFIACSSWDNSTSCHVCF